VEELYGDPTKTLNFYPYYEKLLKERRKTTTVRLGDQTSRYQKGELLTLTCGWAVNESVGLAKIKILDIRSAPVSSLKNEDLKGESPDCLTVEALPYVLSAIYRRVVSEHDTVTVIRWAYLE